MNKAILVIDMPDSCGECPIHASYADSAFSIREYWCTVKGEDINPKTKPDWCPLKPAPELQDVWSDDDDWVMGYNNCVREIIGREEDYE